MRGRATIWAVAILAILLMAFAGARPAAAAEFKSGNDTTIPASQTVNDDLYITGDNVTIAGRVTGDVIAAARDITVAGQIGGSLQVLSGSVEIDGDVAGSVRVATGDLTIAGDVGGDVLAAGNSLTLKSGGTVDGDVWIAGGDVELSGPVGGDVRGDLGTLTINAAVAGTVDVTADKVDLLPKARIAKDLLYKSKNEVARQQGAVVSGRTERSEPSGRLPGDTVMSWITSGLFRLLCGLISGLVIVLLLPRASAAVADSARVAPLTSFLIGLALFWLLPVALLALMVTLVGAPIALVGFAAYVVALYLSQVFLGLAIGRFILPKSWDTAGRGYNLLAMTIGVILLGAVRMVPLPLVGFIIGALTAIFALGALVVAVRSARRRPGYAGV